MGWANSLLRRRNLEIKSFPADLSDGILLGHLYEILSRRKVGKLDTKPKMEFHKTNNVAIVLSKFSEDDVKVCLKQFKLIYSTIAEQNLL
jgi:hypothetical protein